MNNPDERNLCFISYSHKDEEWLEKLLTMLAPLVRAKKLKIWTDKEIQAGDKWLDEIKQALSRAKIAVLLVSKNFLASDFIANNELPPLLEAAEKDGVKVFWIAISNSLVRHTEIGKYQAANNPALSLDRFKGPKLDDELEKICNKLLATVSTPDN